MAQSGLADYLDWTAFPRQPIADTNLENLGKHYARVKWELHQADSLVIAAILWKLRTDPGIKTA